MLEKISHFYVKMKGMYDIVAILPEVLQSLISGGSWNKNVLGFQKLVRVRGDDYLIPLSNNNLLLVKNIRIINLCKIFYISAHTSLHLKDYSTNNDC